MQVLHIPRQLSDTQLRAALELYRDVKLLHFSRTEGAIGAFDKQEDADRFQVGLVGRNWLADGRVRGDASERTAREG